MKTKTTTKTNKPTLDTLAAIPSGGGYFTSPTGKRVHFGAVAAAVLCIAPERDGAQIFEQLAALDLSGEFEKCESPVALPYSFSAETAHCPAALIAREVRASGPLGFRALADAVKLHGLKLSALLPDGVKSNGDEIDALIAARVALDVLQAAGLVFGWIADDGKPVFSIDADDVPTDETPSPEPATGEATNDLRHDFTVFSDGQKTRTKIRIRLNDECKNGREDFSITADIDEKDGRGCWRESGGGCCHDHILKLRPDLAPFVALHLSEFDGVPIHAVENAFYWFGGFNETGEKYHGGSGSGAKTPDECRRIFAEHLNATPEEVAAIVARSPRSKGELQAALEDLAFPAKWAAMARAAIAQLEVWTGKRFESRATRYRFRPLSPAMRGFYAARRASGYYDPTEVAKRDEAARVDRKAARVAAIEKDHAAAVQKLNHKRLCELALAEHFDGRANAIYYDHTGTLSFNWSNIDRLHTRAEFDAFTQAIDPAKMPPGIKYEFNEKPKH